jgi:hypothetical protein
MECCQEIKETQNTNKIAQIFRIFFGLLLLVGGVWLAAQTGMRGQGLGYLFILAAPFAILDDTE